MKKQVIAPKAEPSSSSSSQCGNKVLPITDSTQSSSFKEIDYQSSNVVKKEKTSKVDKIKALTRMKELLKWAAASRAEKGGKYITRKMLHFRHRPVLKAVPDNDKLSNESPKISFRWEVASCSTTYSAVSIASSSRNNDQHLSNTNSLNCTPLHVRDLSVRRKGNWITTDSEFVVLEL